MLAVELTFLTGRYVATAYNTRTGSEWPPHPARLFSALAATHFAADTDPEQRERERAALEWLEGQGPPAIHASPAVARDVVTVFVPVNDVALTDVDDEAAAVEQARHALARAQEAGNAREIKRATTALKKSEEAFARAVTRATAVPARRMDPRYGMRVLPEHRIRQPRTFPSMTPDDPRVFYIWPDARPEPGLVAGLDDLLARLVRVGHSSSLVSARLVDAPPAPTWFPASGGEHVLRVVQPGQLRALERLFERHCELEPRVMPYLPQAYSTQPPAVLARAARPLLTDEWVILRRVEGPHIPMTGTAGLARAVRRTLMAYADEPIPEVLSGHTPDGKPTSRPHLAVVPLSFVGHPHASGLILGVALVLPRDVSAEDRRAVYGAVSRWEQRFRQEDEDTPRVRLNLGAAGELLLERVEWDGVPATLRSGTWCRPARVWHSVTPVALDRNPGDLRARDPEKLNEALGNAAESLRQACERIGLPAPAHIEILPAAPWAGAAKARHYPPFPGEAGRTQRVLTHAQLTFDEPVRGPLLLGAGRFVGLGLFRPELFE